MPGVCDREIVCVCGGGYERESVCVWLLHPSAHSRWACGRELERERECERARERERDKKAREKERDRKVYICTCVGVRMRTCVV